MNVNQIIHDLSWEQLPQAVRNQARRCLLDTIGVAVGGRQTELSKIIHDFVTLAYGGQGAQLWLDGRTASPPGAALANAMTIDALGMHDSCRPVKGHAGVALIPAALATLAMDSERDSSGQELLTTLVVGYEMAIRAGKALHATACDYHTSGAWNALGCAAVTSRRLGLTADKTRHALGIAEYHGPRSQMMRCIDHPTMLKDGSGWGAMAGVSAGMLAATNFTGAPALTVEAPEVAEFWDDLGKSWAILEQYFKPYAVCYWAQPAIAGALALQEKHKLEPAGIEHIRVFTFHEASRLTCSRPQSTEEAQYSLPFPVAMALARGQLGLEELSSAALRDALVLRLAERVEMVDDDSFNARFPADRMSRVVIETTAGATFDSGDVRARWDLTTPPTDEELREKFRWLAQETLPAPRAAALEEMIWHCADLQQASSLVELLVPACQGPT